MSNRQNIRERSRCSIFLKRLGLAVWLCIGTTASAADLRVTNTNDYGAGSLRQAILEAQPNDRILIDSSLAGTTIELTAPLGSFEPNLTIDSSAAPDLTIKRANLSSLPPGMLNLVGNATYTFATITSDTTFAQGADLTFDGDSVISRNVTIANGARVAMNGSITGDTTLAAGGTLIGNGTLTGNTTSRGTMNPGTAGSIDTLNFTGSLTINQGVIQVDIESGGTNDLYEVTGNTTLNGGIVEVNARPGAYTEGASYKFLTSTTLTGEFGGITDNFAFYDAKLLEALDPDYVANSVSFRINDNNTDFAEFGESCNQRSVGIYLDSIRGKVIVDPDLDDFIRGLRSSTTASTQTSLDHLGGQIYAYLPTIQMQHTSFTLAMLRDQLVLDSLYRQPTEQTRGWVRGYGVGGDVDPDSCGTHGFHYSLGGTEIALQRGFGNGLDIGLFTNLAWSLVKTDEVAQRADVDSYQYGVSMQYLGEYGYLLGIAGGGNQNYRAQRSIYDGQGSFSRTAESKFNGSQGFGSLEYGRLLRHGPVSWIPHFAMQYIGVDQGGINETEAQSVSLVGNSIDADSLRSILGLSIQQAGPTSIGPATTKLRFGWMHEYLDTEQVFVSRFQGEAETVAVKGINLGRDWAVMGLNLEWSILPNLTTVVGYQGQFNDRQSLHTGSGGLEARW